jgi:Fic family protein
VVQRNSSDRAGRFVSQLTGYQAFIPRPLPPDPPLAFDLELLSLVSEADRALGELNGVVRLLPNPDLFVAMYVRREAVLSSQIEGTQASLTDVLRFEADEDGQEQSVTDVAEVVNYIAAMNHGLSRLSDLPLSLRLIREIHERLLAGTRGHDLQPGAFRKSQNWIGSKGCTLKTATFVPPPPSEVLACLSALESFLHDVSRPPRIHAALAHAQFETIHPFLDGNGRVGRLLITFLLCHRGVLTRPLLYLSHFLKAHRQEYYDRLQAVRLHGHWEQWLTFFARGVGEVAREAFDTAVKIIELRDQHRAQLSTSNELRTLDLLFDQSMITVKRLASVLQVTAATGNNIVSRMEQLGILDEVTGFKRNRKFLYRPYMALFADAEADA